MSNLIHVGLRRLFREKIFWAVAAAVFFSTLVASFQGVAAYRTMAERGFVVGAEHYYFDSMPYLGAFFAAFVSLFLGTEYTEGTIRNKLIVGHTRAAVYLSHFAVSLTGDLFLYVCWMAGGLPAVLLIRSTEIGPSSFVFCLWAGALACAAFTAIFTWVGMLTPNKALSLLLSLVLWVGMVLAASALNDRLNEPEKNGGMAMIDGEFVMMDETPNPLYVTGAARTAIETALNLLPAGQMILMAETSAQPLFQSVLSLLLTAASLCCGYAFFRRKDLK